MAKSIKFSTKVFNEADVLSGTSRNFVRAKEALRIALEQSSCHHQDLGFMVQFKKSKDGTPMSVVGSQALQRLCAECTQDLLDCTKQLKAVIPAKQGSK